jgi:hypothetical protein
MKGLFTSNVFLFKNFLRLLAKNKEHQFYVLSTIFAKISARLFAIAQIEILALVVYAASLS